MKLKLEFCGIKLMCVGCKAIYIHKTPFKPAKRPTSPFSLSLNILFSPCKALKAFGHTVFGHLNSGLIYLHWITKYQINLALWFISLVLSYVLLGWVLPAVAGCQEALAHPWWNREWLSGTTWARQVWVLQIWPRPIQWLS